VIKSGVTLYSRSPSYLFYLRFIVLGPPRLSVIVIEANSRSFKGDIPHHTADIWYTDSLHLTTVERLYDVAIRGVVVGGTSRQCPSLSVIVISSYYQYSRCNSSYIHHIVVER
jgi:hypothetical protein